MVVSRKLGRAVAIWLGSFAIVGAALAVYCRIPVAPLRIAGGLTLLVTIIRHGGHEKH